MKILLDVEFDSLATTLYEDRKHGVKNVLYWRENIHSRKDIWQMMSPTQVWNKERHA